MGIVGNTPERKVAERLTNAIAKCILEREDGGWWFEHAKVSLMIEHELRALRAENERLRAVAEESLKVMRGSCEMSCAGDPAWYRGKVPSLAWDALCSALFDWDEKKALAALDAKEGT